MLTLSACVQSCITKVHSYIARYPVLGIVQSALHFTPWHTSSFQLYFDFSGKHSAMLQFNTARRLFVQISISVCNQVLIYTTERTVSMCDERNCQSFKTATRRLETGFSQLRARCSYHYATTMADEPQA